MGDQSPKNQHKLEEQKHGEHVKKEHEKLENAEHQHHPERPSTIVEAAALEAAEIEADAERSGATE